ncbi:MAG: peptidoglycan DD-metalloendopeptidase family protein [Cytophagales bacterium]|nr:peptidoglycan DD-metalloendopeptidase family protein [Cytophagales bacterium]
MNNSIKFLPVCALLALLAGCNTRTTPLREVFRKQTSYEKYEQSLRNANLDKTALGQDWLLAGRRVLRDSTVIAIPFQETGYFAADKPTAYSYRIDARRGERIVVRVDVQAQQPVRLFVDVFRLGGVPEVVASSDTAASALDYEVEEDRQHLVRVQPELLRSGRYTISVTSAPSLGFPVAGKDDRAIGSFWGVARDGGRRKHEGLDIFAKRGTPVVASVEGTVRGVNTNRLGGKVVWLSDGKRDQVLYYAHLDQQLVQPGQRVRVGDTLGLVGNTGNAATTQPHLHFGIYRYMGGAVDPYPFLRGPLTNPSRPAVDLEKLGAWHRVSARKAVLRSGPQKNASTLVELDRHTPLVLLAGTGKWYRVALPDAQTGYLAESSVEAIRKPVRKINLPGPAPIFDFPDPAAAVMEETRNNQSLEGLATFGNYWLVQTSSGKLGWYQAEPAVTRSGS